MAKSKASFMKKELEKKRNKKKQDKAQRKEERRENSAGGGLENMMAYVNENGDIVSTPEEAAPKLQPTGPRHQNKPE